ncbi:MAG: hypothetical protein H6741_27530, partial [Alphaproteobacteria bacterium]|nr:hypothetical protein [Alphaproteobacteria bacterium]
KRLEEWAGGRLLHRLPRGSAPTAAGEALAPHAEACLAALDAGRQAVSEVEGLSAGRVVIGGGATACSYLLPPVLVRFRQRYPDVNLLVRETFTPQVADEVRSGRLDLGVAQGEGEPWCEDALVVVATPDTPKDAPWISFVKGAAVRALLDAHFPEAEVAVELRSIAAVKGLVRAGMGVALLPRAACRDELELGHLVERKDARTPITRTLGLVHAGEARLSPAARALREMLVGAG